MRPIRTCLHFLPAALALVFHLLAVSAATAQMSPRNGLADNWRQILEGVDGYPAGPMLEIALRRTHSDKLEMFRWRSEFISMLSAQPGPLVEREWESLSGIPENTGAGTWTGMTWWDNQQSWQDMANMLFPSPVTANWLQTIHMTLIFVKPLDGDFDLRTLAQSGEELLELGILVFPNGPVDDLDAARGAVKSYLDAVETAGANAYHFDVYPNPMGVNGPYTAAYMQNGMPSIDEGEWSVYMVAYPSRAERDAIHRADPVKNAFAAMRSATTTEKSDIQVMTRSTSKVCCQADNMCSLDPGVCNVGILGMGDTWAGNCGQCPRPCETASGLCSHLSPDTCLAVGGKQVPACAR
ncbi:hypothetical protein [Roseibium alexandrii]|uniref:Uncharacterized protein n=1 Tax=Roseibium alexandrii TaxID=388408 RepID=A0A0M7AQM0_9HYPH|nr:hypothetical protein [Roseibium alexandrii]CTQ76550.1 hypothetical protein LAX5112_04630 [Roseibium alexandrii]